ncbi:MAG: sodium-dependent transporter, partial [Pseudomonadota bacterium]
IMLPVGGLLIAVFAGWVILKRATRDELSDMTSWGFSLWRLLVRFIVPPALLVIFVMGVLG